MILADCASGRRLTARVRSERMTEELPYDRRRAAMRQTLPLTGVEARPFFSLERVAEALADVRVPSAVSREDAESCACAAFYPAMRGARTPFAARGRC